MLRPFTTATVATSLIVSSSSQLTGLFSRNVNLEDFTVIWLDANVNRTDDCYETQQCLREIINNLILFDNMEMCIECIDEYETEKIFLIVSDDLGEAIMSHVVKRHQIVQIYIFCLDSDKHLQWASKYVKIGDRVITERQQLVQRLKQDVLDSTRKLRSFENSIRYLDEDPGSFLWFQLLLRALIRMNSSEKAKIDMIEQCRTYFQDNPATLRQIDEFEQTYESDKAIAWYTRDSFIYRIVNRALRTEDIDILFNFRFFLTDLHNQLAKLHVTYREDLLEWDRSTLTVYRGQYMKFEEFNKLRQSIGHIVAMNTFVSVTPLQLLAKIFAGNGSKRPNEESIIFEIEIDVDKCGQPFADIQQHSFMNTEEETLMSIATMVRIKSIVEVDSIWHVKLQATDDQYTPLKEMSDYLDATEDKEMQFINILIIMRDTVKAERYRNALKLDYESIALRLEAELIAEDNADRGETHNKLIDCRYFIESSDVIQTLDRRLSTFIELNDDWNLRAQQMLFTGNYLLHQKEYERALDVLNGLLQVQNIGRQNSMLSLLSTAHFLIANALAQTGNYFSATEHIKHTLKTILEYLPVSHPDMVENHCYIGQIYLNLDNASAALEHLRISAQLAELYLPVNNSRTATIYLNMAFAFYKCNDIDSAQTYLQRCIDSLSSSVYITDSAPTHMEIGVMMYLLNNTTDKIQEEFEKFFEMIRKKKDSGNGNEVEHASFFLCVGKIRYENGQFDKALNVLKTGLVLTETASYTQQNGRNYRADIHAVMGACYMQLKKFDESLFNFDKALKCAEMDLNPGREYKELISSVYEKIGTLNVAMDEWEEALCAYRAAFQLKTNYLTTEFDVSLFALCAAIGGLYQQICTNFNCVDLNCEQALVHLEKAAQIHKVNAMEPCLTTLIIFYQLGYIYYNMNDHEKSISNFIQYLNFTEQIQITDESDVEWMKQHLLEVAMLTGIMYVKMNDFDSAVDVWRHAANVCGKKNDFIFINRFLHSVSVVCTKNDEEIAFF